MAVQFVSIDRDTPSLLPASVQDYIPENHLARFITEVVGQLDLRAIANQYSSGGSQAYPPHMMVALLFYGYATGVFSSRKLERATHDSLAFRYICANTHPDHDSIATFRKRFAKQLTACFTQILLIAAVSGALKLGTISIDGSKVKANASKHRALSWKHANKLEAQIKQEVENLMRMAEAADSTPLPDGLDIPAELERREKRLETIARAKQEIERHAKERHEREKTEYAEKMTARAATEKAKGRKLGGKVPKPPAPEAEPAAKDQVNLTDEESRIMPSKGGFEQSYNAQLGVDTKTWLVVETHVTQACNDQHEVELALRKLEALPNALGKPDKLLADTGYCSETNVEHCREAEITPYFAQGRQGHNPPLATRFAPDPEPPSKDASEIEIMAYRMKTGDGKALYAQRKSTVETVIGIIKHVLGFREFSLRGLELVEAEWSIVCSAWNLKRLHVLMS